MTGRTGYTAVSNSKVPDFGGDITAVYAHFDALINETRANAAALPISGNWAGRLIGVQDTGAVYWWTGSAWRPTALGTVPSVRLRRTALHSSGSPFQTNGGTFRLNWDTEAEDSFNLHSVGTTPERVTIPAGWGGIYQYSAKTRVESNETDAEVLFFLDVNGVKDDTTEVAYKGDYYKRGLIIGEIALAAGDWVAYAVNKPGTLSNLTPNQSYFNLRWIRQ
jgi:hypothetical protein